MFAELLRHELRERRWSALFLGLILAGMSVLIFALTSSLSTAIAQMTGSFPPALTAFIGGGSAGGYAVGELFNLVAPAALVGYTIAVGGSTIAGEEEKGTMSMLSAQPLTRTSIVTSKALALLAGLLGAGLLLWAGAVISSSASGIGLELGGLTAICIHLLLLAVAFGAIAIAVGALTGRSGLSSGLAAGLAVVAYASNAMLPLANLATWAKLSPWYYFAGSNPLSTGINGWNLLVLAGIAAVALVIAYLGFARRDLRG
ncbi:ABC transporter permease subunit [Glaciibacter psychrotolerans]|uniref:ABC-2 type transport system permease protein n=1 Tax=Glaciibacter psychrotolerans TaxID=670054 RepID=A0A7Z0EE18_9MICO|nr:ABC transporter permease subunit [Leifsonia psychrotolerans]NYJ19229.1 ABC-2 type transport system permease protein [Leifsonia psychrotolerans]